MRTTYFIVRILLVVLVLALIINFLLVFNPFSAEETAKDRNGKGIEELKPESEFDILNEGETEKQDSDALEDEEKDIIGYQDSETRETVPEGESGNKGTLNEDNDYFLTYDEIISVENLSFSDKLYGLAVIRKIGRDGLEKMLRIADGGITTGEWGSLNSLLEKYLDDKEIKKLVDMVDKNKEKYEENKLARK